jgi:teichuronic acid exporter
LQRIKFKSVPEPKTPGHLKTGRSVAAIRGAYWSAVNAIVPVAMNSGVFIISSRFLTPNDFGIIALAVSIVMLVSAIAPASFGEALVQLPDIRQSHLDSVFWLCALFALLLFGGLVGLSRPIALLSGHLAILPFLPIIGLRLLFDLGAVVPNALIARTMSFHLLALKTTIATVVSCAICVVMLLAGYGIWALALSQVAVAAAGGIAAFIGAQWLPGRKFNLEALKELSRYGLFASANRFLLYMNLDQIFIACFIGTAPLGIFNFARRLYQMLNDVIAGALGSVSYSLFSSLQNEKDKIREAFLMATFGSSVICFPAFMGLGAIASTAIPLIFGPQWIEAVTPTRWFCVIGLFSCIGVIQNAFINSQGRSDWWFYFHLAQQVVTVGTIFVLRDAGLVTIVMAIAIETAIIWPVTLVMISNLLKLNIFSCLRQFLEPFCAALVMLGCVLFLENTTTDWPQMARLICDLVAGGIVYAGLIFLLCRKRLMQVGALFLTRKGRPGSANGQL